MHGHESYDYAVIRVVPRVEREEFINVGVILSCQRLDWLQARIELDARRLLALAPDADVETISRHLAAYPLICAGGPRAAPIGLLPSRARFHWLTAKRSAVIQASPVHMGRCDGDLGRILEHLMDRMVRR
ncbi:DUF3037 domain-containing protein [Pseudoxanthomonas dokdonensis]|uniref:DUF3037 domain-containing protein n=1 Tax=Pseudoxanthomonas dokdonensis TaxID=344882 RepID=A0A0R0CZX0_9GAMM|nr:DUF3037 domain-containing protein [Pseudoxanthomonas dokdonensis]KRG71671.1 hypothetical protein ABB29_02675 [Pseudoxanthomonas dokdonensis]